MIVVFDVDHELSHVHIGRVLEIRGVDEGEGDALVPLFDGGGAHPRLVIERAIVRQHQLVAVAVVHGRHRGAVGRGERFGQGGPTGTEGKGNLVRFSFGIGAFPLSDQKF
ncbi:MAG: hypothetical protein IPM88_15710 [Nitrospira sp.]|nr:hypothetical protein [Nitrospira sp.]